MYPILWAGLGAVAVVGAVVGLLYARRWLFLVWGIVRPAAWPAAWGLVLVGALGMVGQGQALVQRALETGQGPLLLLTTLVAAALMGNATASLLFVRYEPIATGLEIVREQLRLSRSRYDELCARLRRVAPLVVFALPILALVPGGLALVLPGTYRSLLALVVPAGVLLVVGAGWLAADTVLLRSARPPRQRWLWPLRYPDLSDAGIAAAFESVGHAARTMWRRAGDRLLAGMLPGTRWAFLTAFAAGIVIFLAATNLPTGWTLAVGTAALAVAAAATLAVTGALAAHWVNLRFSVTIPYLLVLLLLGAGLFARWGLSDNHAVREALPGDQAVERARAAARPTLEEHLAEWLLAHRVLGPSDPARPYPLIVAAAEGGGIRAALWTALALGALQERRPSLPCDLFAIAAVSGGAVGAASYAAMLAADPPDCSPSGAAAGAVRARRYADAASEAFGEDLLAPAAAGLLFPDFLQRFLPFPALPDRQAYLEQGWERAWAGAAATMGGLDAPFLALFPAERRAVLPALFLIGSGVEQGRRWIASNVRIDGNTFADAVDTLVGLEIKDSDPLTGLPLVPLLASSAAGLSARFPYVSPAGTLRFPRGDGVQTSHVLDGGVVEASGAATAGEILLSLRSHCDVRSPGVYGCRVLPADPARQVRLGVGPCVDGAECLLVRPAVLQLTNDAWEIVIANAPSWGLGLAVPAFPELLGPIKALLASRAGRGRGAHDRLQGDPLLTAGADCLALDVVLNGDNLEPGDVPVPLGWTLRPAHVKAMRAKIAELMTRPPLGPRYRNVDVATWLANVYERPASEACREPAKAGS